MQATHQSRSTKRVSGTRRGTIVILAVGILAVLAVASLSYMTIVRLDRSSAAAYATEANFRQQVNAAATHIRSLLAADLFGNKIVSGSVNEEISGVTIWPRMFEDGEYWDYPSVSTDWLQNPTDPSRLPSMGTTDASWRLDPVGFRFPAAPRDDAWLASQAPVDRDNGDGVWDTWPQITNLRSGWIYQPEVGQVGYWRRDHGRYVDIAEWLTNSQNDAFTATLNRGDPGLDINIFSTDAAYSTSFAEDNESDITSNNPMSGGPNLGIDKALRGGNTLGTDLGVWEFQMSRMQEFLDGSTTSVDDDMLTIRENIDDRMWADTDGDGRADARWQELDALGELFGYRWLIAARIIDNSAMISVNSSLEWQFPGDTVEVGMGRTPGDIDLFRLLRRSISDVNDPLYPGSRIGHPDVRTNSLLTGSVLQGIWNYNRLTGWRLDEAFQEINDEYGSAQVSGNMFAELVPNSSATLNDGEPLGAREREMFWKTAGASPQRRAAVSAVPVPIGDEIDLRAYFGFNYPRFVSKIEGRLEQLKVADGDPPMGWLPGMPPTTGGEVDYPEPESLGPMRSKEDGREARSYDLDALLPDNDFIGDYFQADKIERIRTDIRRHMTTVNGSSDVSPIPVLNTLAFPKQYSTTKIRLDDPDSIRDPVTDASQLAGDGFKQPIGEFIEQAYGAFIWALAPMATNIPLTSEISPADVGPTSSGSAAFGVEFAYGGGANGPATTLDPLMGPAYAILRAASLAVNLADAMDQDANSEESPTVVRLAGNGAVLNAGDREIRLNPSDDLPHGRIEPNLFNDAAVQRHMGLPNNGVTMVGLDRQPFLMEATHFALYQDFQSKDFPGMIADDVIIDPSDPLDHVGSVFMVEIGNPWPEQIDVSNYFVRMSTGATEFRMPLKAAEMDPYFSMPGDSLIDPGQSKTFWILFPFDELEPSFYDVFNGYFNPELFDELNTANALVLGDNLVLVDETDAVFPNTNPCPLATTFPVGPGAGNTAVQLWYDDPSIADLAYLVDRMADTAGGSFPNLDSLPTLDPFIPPPGSPAGDATGSGRVAAVVSMRRPKGTVGSGFPAYVVERGDNAPVPAFETQQWRFAPSTQNFPSENQLTYPPINMIPNIVAEVDLNLGSGVRSELATFQLFVPNGPFRSVAELHMLCAFTHMYVNNTFSYNMMNSLMAAGAPTGPTNPIPASIPATGYWLTVSEQLGMNAHFFYDGATTQNPYLGVLDPSRFVYGANGDLAPTTTGGTEWPDFLRIPLATRVFDCFQVITSPTQLAQGKINLNTAPIEVLESMPFFAPESDVEDKPSALGTLPSSVSAIASGTSRANLVQQYRDLEGAFDPLGGGSLTRTGNLMGGLRDSTDPITNQPPRGLVSVGELLAMADWTSSDGVPGGDGTPSTGVGGFDDFLQLGVDTMQQAGPPLTLRYNMRLYGSGSGITSSSDFNEFGNFINRNDYAAITYSPIDGPEERLALARSALDIASTRSDVFTAYFILRAYDPEQIEVIQTQGVPDLQTKAKLLDEQGSPFTSPGLRPVYESRWLGVFDRSEVRRPNDKPRVLLLVELPID